MRTIPRHRRVRFPKDPRPILRYGEGRRGIPCRPYRVTWRFAQPLEGRRRAASRTLPFGRGNAACGPSCGAVSSLGWGGVGGRGVPQKGFGEGAAGASAEPDEDAFRLETRRIDTARGAFRAPDRRKKRTGSTIYVPLRRHSGNFACTSRKQLGAVLRPNHGESLRIHPQIHFGRVFADNSTGSKNHFSSRKGAKPLGCSP